MLKIRKKIVTILRKKPKVFKKLQKWYYKIIEVIDIKRRYQNRQQKVCWGEENPDKTFYVIRRPDDIGSGLLSWTMTTLGHLNVADKHGWIPVVDMQNIMTMFHEPEEYGKVNAWEFFYKQPCGYTLDDIKHSKNIVLSSKNSPKDIPYLYLFDDAASRDRWRALCEKYIFLQEDIKIDSEKMVDKIKEGKPMLGLICRGTDYWALQPFNHPVQPNIEQIIEQTDIALEKTGADRIYLCTEDKTIIADLTRKYGSKITIYPREYIDYLGDCIAYSSQKSKQSNRQLAHDYLMQILVLSKMDYIVGGRVSGTIGALLFSQGYRYEYFWDLGRYA